MKCTTIGTVKLKGEFHPPGTEIDLTGKDLDRAVELGAVRKGGLTAQEAKQVAEADSEGAGEE